jgi:hypothetical protein
VNLNQTHHYGKACIDARPVPFHLSIVLHGKKSTFLVLF